MTRPFLFGLGLGALALGVLYAGSAQAGPCEGQSPALPVPMELWTDAMRPAPTQLANDQLPDTRDSTDYITQTIPGLQTGHEQFSGVVSVGGTLFVAYNAGRRATLRRVCVPPCFG